MEQLFTIRRRKKPILIDGKVKRQGESYLAIYKWTRNNWQLVSESCTTMKQVRQYIKDRTPINTVSKIIEAR